MNFIYDIVLNFNKEYYDFFEWNKKDCIINIKKIPLFVVTNDIFKSMKYDFITVSKDFIDSIKDKTYTYNRQIIGPSCLLSNGKSVIGLLFNDNGNLIKRSSLLLDEEDEVLDEIYTDVVTNIDIVKIKKCNNTEVINRIQKQKKEFLIKYINKEKNHTNLKYLYYDYFEKDDNEDVNSIRGSLINEIKNNWNKKFDNIYDTVKIFCKINN